MSVTTGFLGPAGTFTEEAVRRFAPDAQAVPYASEREAILAVAQGAVEQAVVPIENSLEGGVTATLDTLAGEPLPVTIAGEVVLSISHCLIGREGHEISTVISHPQALGQCRRFLGEQLPSVEQVAATSTAEAVRTVAQGRAGLAAIGSRAGAELYGLDVLREGIEDDPGNQTRFVVIAHEDAEPVAGSGDWKTTLVFQGAGDDSPGWLVRCLSELAFRGINLTKIESRPNKRQLGHYLFVLDLQGAQSDPDVAAAITGLRGHCEEVRVLGSYMLAQA
jgi:prephenate dehydratase